VVGHRAAAACQVSRERTELLAIHGQLVCAGVRLALLHSLAELLQAVMGRPTAEFPAVVEDLGVLAVLVLLGAGRAAKGDEASGTRPHDAQHAASVHVCPPTRMYGEFRAASCSPDLPRSVAGPSKRSPV